MRSRLPAVLFVASLCVLGCSGEDGAAATPQSAPAPTTPPVTPAPATSRPTASASTPTTSAPASPDPAGKLILTERDSGREATVREPGVSIRLGHGWGWQEPRVLGGAVRLNQVNYLVDPGFTEWVVAPVRAGTATVHIEGLPQSKDKKPMDVTFTFHVR
ncbi:hypothetical protein ACGFNU_32145 [Spirillospora sp. NPDC048911]|uniref:hypothetical protein n=1 Tax=Spirillospora sp. NPDC048911 TaxID=3364527 RepID=UPI003719588C